MRSLRAVLLVAVLALAGVGVLASPADAHALLQRSYPAAGASLPRAPHVMLLYFTEAPDPSLSTVSLLDSSGQTVPGVGKPTVGAGQRAGAAGERCHLSPTACTRSTGARCRRSMGMSPAAPSPSASASSPPSGVSSAQAANGGSPGSAPSPAAVAGLWLLYWGLALLAAAGVTGPLVFGWRLPGRARIVIAAGWLARPSVSSS